MDEKLIELLNTLNNELINHPLIKEVKRSEKEMEENEEFMHKVIALENITVQYNDAIKYNLPLEELQKKLFEAKYQLDTLNVVIEYRKKYQEAQKYLDEIAKTLFANISPKLKVNELL